MNSDFFASMQYHYRVDVWRESWGFKQTLDIFAIYNHWHCWEACEFRMKLISKLVVFSPQVILIKAKTDCVKHKIFGSDFHLKIINYQSNQFLGINL